MLAVPFIYICPGVFSLAFRYSPKASFLILLDLRTSIVAVCHNTRRVATLYRVHSLHLFEAIFSNNDCKRAR